MLAKVTIDGFEKHPIYPIWTLTINYLFDIIFLDSFNVSKMLIFGFYISK